MARFIVRTSFVENALEWFCCWAKFCMPGASIGIDPALVTNAAAFCWYNWEFIVLLLPFCSGRLSFDDFSLSKRDGRVRRRLSLSLSRLSLRSRFDLLRDDLGERDRERRRCRSRDLDRDREERRRLLLLDSDLALGTGNGAAVAAANIWCCWATSIGFVAASMFGSEWWIGACIGGTICGCIIGGSITGATVTGICGRCICMRDIVVWRAVSITSCISARDDRNSRTCVSFNLPPSKRIALRASSSVLPKKKDIVIVESEEIGAESAIDSTRNDVKCWQSFACKLT